MAPSRADWRYPLTPLPSFATLPCLNAGLQSSVLIEPKPRPGSTSAGAPILRFGRWYWLTGVVLAAADLIVFAACGTAAVWLWTVVERQIVPGEYLALWPMLLVFLGVSAMVKLYPGVGTHPVEEFRRQGLVISLVFLVFATGTFMFKQGPVYSRAVFVIAWAMCFIAVPIARTVTKLIFKKTSWFGYPAVIFGNRHAVERLVAQLGRYPNLGLRTRAIVSSDPTAPTQIASIPVIDVQTLIPTLREAGKVPYALVGTENMSRETIKHMLEGPLQSFRHVILIPDLPLPATLWMTGRDLGGMLGLEIEHRLLDPSRRLLKRSLDLLALCVLLPVFLPVFAVLAALIKMDSKGPVLIGLRRVGFSGKIFHQMKFRTMVVNNDHVLRDALARDPALKKEWDETQKLRNDPRLTRVGKWLRRTSVDELPQIFNVLIGQMSLVGPRPITTGETAKYEELASVYTKSLPGMTGLWQVSGRNDLSYDDRVTLDAYYVRNWSIWLDLYIVIKTVWVVLTGRGAY